MAHSLSEALVRAGVVREDDTPQARQARAGRERQQQEAAAVAARLADHTPIPRWDPPPAGVIVDEARPRPAPLVRCASCGERFDPTAPEHKPFGRQDRCGPCARGEAPGPRRKRGQMVWTHKTAPSLEIEGGRKLTPEELAAMRRR